MASLLASYRGFKAPRSPSRSHEAWSFHTDPPQPVQTPSAGAAFRSQDQQERRPPLYNPDTPPPPSRALAQNPNRANAGRNPNPYTGGRLRNYQPAPKDMPDRSTSKNPWINGTLFWSQTKDGLLCVKCGNKGHISQICKGSPLPEWKQSYLKMIVFGDNPQVSFASVGFGEYKGSVRPYGSPPQPAVVLASLSTTSSSDLLTPTTLSIDSYISPGSNSVQFRFAGLLRSQSVVDSNAAEANFGEGSGHNKRPREDQPESSRQASQRRLEKRPEQRTPRKALIPLVPEPQVSAPQSYESPQVNIDTEPPAQQPQAEPQVVPQAVPQKQPGVMPQQQPQTIPQVIPQTVPQQQQFQFQANPPAQAANNRPKKKGVKHVGKKADPQPLVGMFNGTNYDSPVSI